MSGVSAGGSLWPGRQLIIPCALSDDATTFSTLSLDAVLPVDPPDR